MNGGVLLSQADAALRSRRLPRGTFLALLGAALALAVVLGAAVGSMWLPPARVVRALVEPLGLGGGVTAAEHAVIWSIRLPRLLLGVAVGGGLGLAGAAMQGLFRNPLVDPGLLGVSSGAALGAALVIVLGARLSLAVGPTAGPWVLPLAAFAMAFVSVMAVRALATVDGAARIGGLLLSGIAVNGLASALTGLLTSTANDAQLRTLVFWTLGSLDGATWRTAGVAVAFLAAPVLLLPRLARTLDVILLGEAEAGDLGIDVETVKRRILLLVSLTVGASVAFTGVLLFVGLAVPHLVRLAAGPDHRVVLPGAFLLGAALLVGADAAARTVVAPAELPLGLVTASLGAPFFVFLLVREKRSWS